MYVYTEDSLFLIHIALRTVVRAVRYRFSSRRPNLFRFDLELRTLLLESPVLLVRVTRRLAQVGYQVRVFLVVPQQIVQLEGHYLDLQREKRFEFFFLSGLPLLRSWKRSREHFLSLSLPCPGVEIPLSTLPPHPLPPLARTLLTRPHFLRERKKKIIKNN